MIEIETQRLTIISETKENVMNKPAILFILVATFVGSGPLLFGLRFEMQGIAVKDE